MDPALSAPDRPKLNPSDIRHLSRRSNLRSSATALIIYGGIIGIVAVATLWTNIWTLLLGGFLIAGFQHNLSILQHEAVHSLFSTNKRWNDLAGNWLLGYPIGFTMHYREIHLAHHSHLGGDKDPDMVNYESYPNTASFFLTVFLRNITGVSAIKQSLEMAGIIRSEDPHTAAANIKPVSRWHIFGLAMTQIIILGLFSAFSHWWMYFVLWLLPLLTMTKTLANIRNAVEHTAIVENAAIPFARYRTIRAPFVEKFFLSPLNFNYHAEHHLHPSIPYFNLPKAHQLMSSHPSYRKYIHLIPGYMYFVRNFMVQRKVARSEC